MGTHEDILNTLDALSLTGFGDRAAALLRRFDAALAAAAKILEPQTTFISLPRRTFKQPQDVDAWLKEVGEQLKVALTRGPVAIQ